MPLFLNAAMVAQVLGISPSSSYALLHSKGSPPFASADGWWCPEISSLLG